MLRTTMGGILALAFAVALAGPAQAAVVNVDFGLPGDATHAGSDGILSIGGTAWNGVVYDTDAPALLDESGGTTPVGLAHLRTPTPPGPFMSLGVPNDLQDSGVLGSGFDLTGLMADSLYTLAVYAGSGVSFTVQHAGGYAAGSCPGFPSYALPGTEGSDYCLLVDLAPAELSPGVFGLRLSAPSGAIFGLQLLGATEAPAPPAVDETPPECVVASTNSGPPRSLTLETRDLESGLGLIAIVSSDNASVQIPSFDLGTTDPVMLTVTQGDPTQSATVQLQVTDVEGNGGVHEFQLSGAPVTATGCESVLDFFDSAVTAGTLVGNGPGNSANGRRGAMRSMLEGVCSALAAGDDATACGYLRAALKKCDGDEPDFVTGEAAPELESRMQILRGDVCWDDSPRSEARGTRSASGPVIPMTWGLVKTMYGMD